MVCNEIEHIKSRIIDLGRFSSSDEQRARNLLSHLVDNAKHSSEKSKKSFGNPAVVGLAGFGVTTMLFQCVNFGAMKIGPVLWLGLLFGGLSQFIAGFLEFICGNNFGFAAFTTYGIFWMSICTMLITSDYTKYEAGDTEMAFFLGAFLIYSCIMLVASTKQNLAMAAVFLFLVIGLIFHVFFHIFPHLTALKIIGAVMLLGSALGALYILAAIILADSFKTSILPLGQPFGSKRIAAPSPELSSCSMCCDEKPHEGVTLIHLQPKNCDNSKV